MAFDFYTDAALTTRVSGRIAFTQDVSSADPCDKIVYFGNPVSDGTIASANGTATITVTPAGTGAGDVYLAATAGGLDSAIGGAPIDLGTDIASGLASAVAVFIRVLDSSGVVGVNSDVQLVMTEVFIHG